MKKNHFLVIVVIFVIISALFLRIREYSGQWVCQNDQWVKQGRTLKRPPNTPCPEVILKTPDIKNIETPENLLGSDRDEYGCLSSAGYIWCPSLAECIRSWEVECPLNIMNQGSEELDPLAIEPITGSPIRIAQPLAGEILSSPYEVRGWAPGTWFFEANLPIKLLDATGELVVITGAMTSQDWMTENLVPFSGILEFSGVSGRGELVIMKDNPTGLPEFDAEVRLPIRFSEN